MNGYQRKLSILFLLTCSSCVAGFDAGDFIKALGIFDPFDTLGRIGSRHNCNRFNFSNNDDFNARHASLIFVGLRRVSSGDARASWTLAVYHRLPHPYEVSISHFEPADEVYADTIRLFLKPNKTFVVFYQSKDRETIMETYQLRSDLHLADSVNTRQTIEMWKITDSSYGFYDASNCGLIRGGGLLPDCAEQCSTKNFEKISRYVHFETAKRDYPVFNRYHCMNFIDAMDGIYVDDLGNKPSTVIITDKDDYHYGDDLMCLSGPENFRQMQFYDLRWDKYEYDPCTMTPAELGRKAEEETFADGVEQVDSRETNVKESVSIPRDCSKLPWFVVGVADVVLILLIVVVISLGSAGQRAKHRHRRAVPRK